MLCQWICTKKNWMQIKVKRRLPQLIRLFRFRSNNNKLQIKSTRIFRCREKPFNRDLQKGGREIRVRITLISPCFKIPIAYKHFHRSKIKQWWQVFWSKVALIMICKIQNLDPKESIIIQILGKEKTMWRKYLERNKLNQPLDHLNQILGFLHME